MGLFGTLFKILGVLILVVIGLGAYLYFTDYEAQATITDKGSDGGTYYIELQPKLLPTTLRQDLDRQSWDVVCEGYQVTYRVQSGHYRVFDRSGDLVYDSEKGLASAVAPVRCAALGA